ncbi:GAF and ANTAR domain-containing protein [Paeniglutamicibacter antarcticus]|uniref:GAF and ANTAR domain-containing protein n=1 Tax=Arthrobacter terrae TaxID=2935737 RepID=A0A931CQD3_9MICC|nr:GAF and ANTAR domain-containing protein [Arthrobacter terrae]MBG0740465.1 GAF and ANTAR domain-containing protein [Arthrobacter terrae]
MLIGTKRRRLLQDLRETRPRIPGRLATFGVGRHNRNGKDNVAIDATARTSTPESSIGEYLHTLILQSEDIDAFLNGLACHAAQILSSADDEVLCGITLLRDRKAGTVASSSDRARHMDEIQYSFGDGPCMTASRDQVTVHVPDLETENRWPEYSATVHQSGMRSILAIPFNLEGDAKAALNLYSARAGKFDARVQETVQRYTREVTTTLQLGLRFAQHIDTASNLKSALESRTIIDLAVGIIMAQNRCSQETAVGILKSASSARNLKLRDVATALVQSINQEAAHTHFD